MVIFGHKIRACGVVLCGCLVLSCLTGCSPIYTWGYAKSIHPASTHAYILAVLARENGDYQTALAMYDEALRHTWSDRVAAERNDVAQLLKNAE